MNNAGAAMYGSSLELSLKRRRLLFEVNVHAPLDLSQAVIPAMLDRGDGWIVNVSSGAARSWDGPPFALGVTGAATTSYGASKLALNRVTNGLGAELYGRGVRANTVEPRSAVRTEGAEAMVGESIDADRFESLEEMVEAVVALCDCGPEVTARSFVSLELLEQWGVVVQGLDGLPLDPPLGA